MHWKCSSLAAAVTLAVSCASFSGSNLESFIDRHYAVGQNDNIALRGPLKVVRIEASNSLTLDDEGSHVSVTLRGCLPTGFGDIDLEAKNKLMMLRRRDIYLRDDSVVRMAPKHVVGIIYIPANRVYAGRSSDGGMLFSNLTYVAPQVLRLVNGQYILDNTDTNYPMYEVFREAEALAKKHRKGCWASQPKTSK